MPLLADENTPYLETPAERMRRLLGQNTQGVAPGIAGSSPSTRTTVPRSQLPAWVQQRLREQEAATPPAPQAVAPPRPLGPSADPRARADRLREILESPIRGTAPGIAGNPSLRPTTRATPVSYADDPYFDNQIAQDDRAAYSPWTPSTYRTQRAEEQLWAAEPGVGLGGRTGTEGAYDQARPVIETSLDEPETAAIEIEIDPIGLAKWGWGLGVAGAERGIDFAVAANRDAIDALDTSVDFALEKSDAVIDAALGQVGDELERLEPVDTGTVNSNVGALLAAWTGCPDTRVVPPVKLGDPPVTIHENCGDHPVFKVTRGRPFTFGSHVFVRGPLVAGGARENEERYHAGQYTDIGDLFIIRYLLELAAHGYLGNEFEQDAKRYAGIPVPTPSP